MLASNFLLVVVTHLCSDRWEKAPPNTEVGKLRIKKKVAGAKPEVNLTLADSICAQVGLAGLAPF